MKTVHIVPTYGEKHLWPDNVKRARKSWIPEYTSDFTPLEVHITSLGRNSQGLLGGKRELPFVKDLINIGFKEADRVVLTNLDIGICSGGISRIKGKTGFGFRRDFLKPIRSAITQEYLLRTGQKSSGVDLISLDRGWWEQHRENLPDLLLGCEGWDWVYRFTLNRELDSVIYHEYHGTPEWKVGKTSSVENLYNRKLCWTWFQGLSEDVKPGILKLWPELKVIPNDPPVELKSGTKIPVTQDLGINSKVNVEVVHRNDDSKSDSGTAVATDVPKPL